MEAGSLVIPTLVVTTAITIIGALVSIIFFDVKRRLERIEGKLDAQELECAGRHSRIGQRVAVVETKNDNLAARQDAHENRLDELLSRHMAGAK